MRVQERSALATWAAPRMLFAEVDAARISIGDRFCVGARTSHLREAWTIGKTCMLIDADACCLTEKDPPDGWMRLGGREVPVEVTTLLAPDRRWGDELKSPSKNVPQHISQAEMDFVAENNLSWLTEVIQSKIKQAHKYPAGTVLLVYHNSGLWNWDSALDRIRGEIETASTISGANIVGSLILFSGSVYGQSTLERLRRR
jgi:hypothetical protein